MYPSYLGQISFFKNREINYHRNEKEPENEVKWMKKLKGREKNIKKSLTELNFSKNGKIENFKNVLSKNSINR